MATIVIKDLTESLDLDRQAMVAITGGARLRGRQSLAGLALRSHRIVDYPAGFRSKMAPAGAQAVPGKPAK